jgi:Mg2+ and Co2+ transporter CorA
MLDTPLIINDRHTSKFFPSLKTRRVINSDTESHVETNKMKKITVLKAEVAPWSTVAGTYSMDFGNAYMSPG